MRGHLANGRTVDPYRGGKVTVVQPESVASYFETHRWRINFWILAREEPDLFWSPMAGYLCDRWNAGHQGHERMVSIDVEVWLEILRPKRANRAELRGRIVSQRCTDLP